ncbi:hypothetical protein Rin_00000600 [Candidatus Regiella insecticola 5.15]|uniref:Uncharacterized protein n=1 Tax=Candidatus Regiella insecticola 5.15 TaxID=1005043 RepID=G2GWC7_9ENTR|nr:hypothetical protein [Candidatus Regiella insecticola]EGY29960.1 hypothetical protein Rin_00000600 [Candidatus Regiella insecticola 5.15]
MSLIIQGATYLPFNIVISEKRLKRTIYGSSKEDAIKMGVWGKIKDWVCRNKKSKSTEEDL